jgi:hypothetical protein
VNRFIDSLIGLGGFAGSDHGVAVTTMILRHQERIAKIERGLDAGGRGPPRSLKALGVQPDVGRQYKIDSEHWVGGILEFARLWS